MYVIIVFLYRKDKHSKRKTANHAEYRVKAKLSQQICWCTTAFMNRANFAQRIANLHKTISKSIRKTLRILKWMCSRDHMRHQHTKNYYCTEITKKNGTLFSLFCLQSASKFICSSGASDAHLLLLLLYSLFFFMFVASYFLPQIHSVWFSSERRIPLY